MAGTLSVVATPIGNLEDITVRAIRVLGEVDLIAAEDTRRTGKLLAHYGIKTPMTSYFEHNEFKRGGEIIARLKAGTNVALVTDAGTPAISDPGYKLVRSALTAGLKVETVPGASACIAALSLSGLPTDGFTFTGFVPRGPLRVKKFFLSLKGTEGTYVMYESPKRLRATMEAIKEALGGDAELCIARELTKIHEELLRGTVESLLLKSAGVTPKGEVVIILRTVRAKAAPEEITEELKGLLSAGFKLSEAASIAAREFGLPKSSLYKEAVKLKQG